MNEAAFYDALHDDPEDKVTWLALADWLEEADQLPRADLVRTLLTLRGLSVRGRGPKRAALEDRVLGMLHDGVEPAVPQRVNSLGMRLVLLPAGRVRMGSPAGETMRGEDEVTHEVRIARPFYLGVFPVTQREFFRVTRRNPSIYRKRGAQASDVVSLDTSRFPVENVTWRAAVGFCKRLSERTDEQAAGLTYRLPTEAEWEYACRAAGTSLTAFAFGGALGPAQANCDGEHPYGGVPKGPSLSRTVEVGSYRPNAWGLYDMHGNVWEWCSDVYAPYPTREQDETTTGSRVVRGGAYYNYAAWCRSARRGSVGEAATHGHIGFRVAADWVGGG